MIQEEFWFKLKMKTYLYILLPRILYSKIWLFSTYDFSLFNNYLIISEHYVSELIYVTLSLGGNPQPQCIKVVSFVEYNYSDA